MGHADFKPADPTTSIKLRLQRLRFTDDSYGPDGTYWGSPANVWCAQGTDEILLGPDWLGDTWRGTVLLFRRAEDRDDAKRQILTNYPNARFYR